MVVVFLVITSFLMVRLVPGDPARRIAGLQGDPAAVKIADHRLGLDRPMLVQFTSYVGDLARLNLGRSFQTDEPVTKIIGDRFWTTFEVALLAIGVVLVTGVPLGLAVAGWTNGRNRGLELGFAGVTGLVGSMPAYLLGTFLVWIFAVMLHWLPVAGTGSIDKAILPALALGLGPMAMMGRVVRIETLNVLAQDYVRTARSKRLPTLTLYVRHVLPNVVAPVLSIAGVLLTALIAGSVVIERVFARAGLGDALVRAVFVGDYPVVQGLILLFGIAVVTVNTIVDLAAASVDHRLRTMTS